MNTHNGRSPWIKMQVQKTKMKRSLDCLSDFLFGFGLSSDRECRTRAVEDANETRVKISRALVKMSKRVVFAAFDHFRVVVTQRNRARALLARTLGRIENIATNAAFNT